MTAVSCFLSVTTVPAYETVLQLLENLQKHQSETYLLSKLNRRPSREPGSRQKATRPLSGDTTRRRNGLRANFVHPRSANELLRNSYNKGSPQRACHSQ